MREGAAEIFLRGGAFVWSLWGRSYRRGKNTKEKPEERVIREGGVELEESFPLERKLQGMPLAWRL